MSLSGASKLKPGVGHGVRPGSPKPLLTGTKFSTRPGFKAEDFIPGFVIDEVQRGKWPTTPGTPERTVAESACTSILETMRSLQAFGITIGPRIHARCGSNPCTCPPPLRTRLWHLMQARVCRATIRGCLAYLRWSTGDPDLEIEDCYG